MHSYFVRALSLSGALAAGLGLAATAADAQQTDSRSPSWGIELAPYAGYMIFGNYLEGPLGTSISNAGGAVFGAQLGVRLSRHLSVIGNLGHANADLRVGVPLLGGISIGSSSVWLYDGGLQLGLPARSSATRSIAPFVQLGAGALHHTVRAAFIETSATNFAANVGLGADLEVSRNVGLRLLAKDYVGKFDFKEATMLPVDGKLAHNVTLSAGVSLSF